MAFSRADLQDLAAIHVRDAIPPEPLAAALSSPPFIPTRSLVNVRDLGAVPGSAIRPGRIFRSGMLDAAAADPDALAWLAANVGTVFDLRTYKPTIRAVLEHVRDKPQEPFLFHCTAGRDRTGVVAGLLQTLAGTEQPDVIFDYMLSRIGTEQARDRLVVFIKAALGVDDPETPGFWNMASLRPTFWKAFVEGVDAEFGGWDGYVTEALGFSVDDLETIKKNLRA
ncbi:hypothetical protein CEP54_011891 [Fusarium duplospermum]|uniref:Tyrosine specific protein phosphatases domain-containing protein n=1 Tax=Fusarium duplospermum TaxID=1325734 RepID=A0A428PBQ9_9HYPO|nr:hypothetical protein CEP54_011891 [Fusarium duplospermum]